METSLNSLPHQKKGNTTPNRTTKKTKPITKNITLVPKQSDIISTN